MVPLLLIMLFGIIQYALYFNDALNARQGVRESVRSGAVGNFPACGAAVSDWDKLKCTARNQVGMNPSATYVKVSAPGGWAKNKPLLVCVITAAHVDIGFVPLPNGGNIFAKTQMSIETDTMPTGLASSDAAPSGTSWTFCT